MADRKTPDQLVMITSIEGGDVVQKGQSFAAYIDIKDQAGSIIRLASQETDLSKLEVGFGDLRGAVARKKRELGMDTGIEPVTALTAIDLQVRVDIENGGLVLQLLHANGRSTYVSLSEDQTTELMRRLDAARADLSSFRKPN